MSENYRTLPYSKLEQGTTYQRPQQQLPEVVRADSPATDVMTDLTKVAAITIGPCANVDQAEQRMVASTVRLLLVTDQSHNILGLITLTDLRSEKPLKYQQSVGCKREDIFVRDIMTHQEQLEVLFMVDVVNAKVGDIIETLKRVGRQHALVVDLDEERRQIVRGIISTKQISKQLGINIETAEVAKTFAELEATLG